MKSARGPAVLVVAMGLGACATVPQATFRQQAAERLAVSISYYSEAAKAADPKASPCEAGKFDEKDVGAGFLFAQDAAHWFVLTANHVATVAKTFCIRSPLSPGRALTARPLPDLPDHPFGQDLDANVLVVDVPATVKARPYWSVLAPDRVLPEEKLYLIGPLHGSDRPDAARLVLAGQDNPLPGMLVMAPGGIAPGPGDSGAPIFTSDWRLLGLYTSRVDVKSIGGKAQGTFFAHRIPPVLDVVRTAGGTRQISPALQPARSYIGRRAYLISAGLAAVGLGFGYAAYSRRHDYYDSPTSDPDTVRNLNITADVFLGLALVSAVGMWAYNRYLFHEEEAASRAWTP